MLRVAKPRCVGDGYRDANRDMKRADVQAVTVEFFSAIVEGINSIVLMASIIREGACRVPMYSLVTLVPRQVMMQFQCPVRSRLSQLRVLQCRTFGGVYCMYIP